jgi:glucokinase
MAEKQSRRRSHVLTPTVIALEVQSEQVRGALVNDSGRILAQRTTPIAQPTVRATVAAISHLILDLAELPERKTVRIKGIGISVPGIVDERTARVSFTHREGFNWARVPLGTLIEKTLRTSGVDIRFSAAAAPTREAKMESAHPPFAIYANRDTQVAAEAWCGAAAGKSDVIMLSLENPLNAGLLVDGAILHGAGDEAGAVGFFALCETSKGEYTARGALAFEASEAALVRRTLEQWTAASDSLLSQLTLADPAQLTAAMILRAARSGDPLALRVVEETCHWVARAVANLISLLNPEVVLIGGNFGLKLKPFLSTIRREAKQWANPSAVRQCQITTTKLGEQTRLLGAARLAWMKIE